MLGFGMNRFISLIPVLLLVFVFLLSPLPVSIAYATEDSWTALKPMPTARMHFGVAVVDGKIYAIGGYKGYSGSYLASNEMYDPATNTCTTKASMPTPRSGFGAAVVDNKIYVIGGSTGTSKFTNVNEVYDPETDTWETLTPMPTTRHAMEANVVDGKIYVIGGSANVNEVYDTKTDTWTTLEPMPTSVGYYSSAVVGTKIYIFGGAVEVALTQIYDTKTDTWSNGTALPTGVDSAAAAVIEVKGTQKICVIGGKQNLDAVNLNQIYDTETDTWSTGAAMPTARYGLATAVVDTLVYAIGGAPSFPYASLTANEQYTPAGYIPDFYSQIFDAGTWEDVQYDVFVVSNSTVSNFSFNHENTLIRFDVEGEDGTTGVCNVTIPKNLLDTENTWTVLVDEISVTPTVNEKENYTTLHVTYSHSNKTVKIIGTTAIPEFPSWTPALLVLIVLAVTLATYKRKLPRKQN